ncbi:MAG: NEW3 domain-containing protein [Tepidisphaeraceae bacterium]
MIARRFFIFVGLLPFLAAAGPAVGFASAADTGRIVKSVDFEERRLGNMEDLPMHWTKVGGPGLPDYVNGKLADDAAHSGRWSFRFDLNGGSLIYRYDPRQVPIRQGAHYRVDCFVQTTELPHARARITAYFTDAEGNAIDNSTSHSELYAAKVEGEGWHELSLEVSASNRSAAFLAVQLELIQPSAYARSNLGARTLFDEDIYGSAWFDDLTISQVPEVTLSSNHPGNVFRRSDPLQLSVRVNDRFTDDLAAQLIISDAGNAVIYQHSGALDMGSAQDLGPGLKQMLVALPELAPGWYDAVLVMTSRGQLVGRQEMPFVRLADDEMSNQPDPRFGVIATDLPFEGWSQLPDLLSILAAGRVKLSVWSSGGDVERVDPAGFDALLERLGKNGITPTACLTAVPPELAAKIGGSEWTRLIGAAPETWRGELSYLVARHANHLDRWQFGADEDAADFLQKPGMRKVYDLLYREFAKIVVKPDLAMPWPAWYDLGGNLPATVALSISPDVLPSQLPLYIQDIRGHEGHNLSLSLQLLDDSYGREVQIRDLAQRVVYALAGGASRIDLPLPFTVRKDGDAEGEASAAKGEACAHVTPQPKELLLIIRTLLSQLSGATFRGKVPNASNVEAFLFDRNGEGLMVIWSRGQDNGAKPLALNLGDHPRRVDLWGNTTPLILSNRSKSEAVTLDVGPMPFFLVDIDSATAQMRASVAIDKPLLESSFQPHVRHIRFSNPGQATIAGMVRLVPPPGWTLTPSVFNFTLNPGEAFEHELVIEFPYNSFAGAKTITAQFQVQSDRNTTFSVPVTVNLGLSDVGMRTLALRDKDDLIVQQMISNYGDKPINYNAFVVYPGQPRQERLVTQLGPGRTIIKLYRFPDVHFISNAKVRSGLRELEGMRILNDEVAVQ